MVLTIVAMLSMTMTFATTTPTTTNDAATYSFNVNNNALARSLKLNEEQEYFVNIITSRFEYDMKRAGKATDADRQKKLRKAVKHNLGQMSQILTREQFRKYLTIINATFVNRGITIM